MLGGAGVAGLLTLGALTATLIGVLDTAMAFWLAALIVTVVWARRRRRAGAAGPQQDPAGDAAGTADRRDREGGRAMGQDPDMIRSGHRGDPRAHGRHRRRARLQGRRQGARQGSVSDKVGRAQGEGRRAPATAVRRDADTEQVKHGARQAVGVAQENPLGLAVGAVAVGFLAGMLIPRTRVEDEKLGPMADQVKEQVKETGPGGDGARQAGRAGRRQRRRPRRRAARSTRRRSASSLQPVGTRAAAGHLPRPARLSRARAAGAARTAGCRRGGSSRASFGVSIRTRAVELDLSPAVTVTVARRARRR